jgi:SAM-dependent methyltransferase
MRTYYDARLAEYDDVYKKPERQEDLEIVRCEIRERVATLDVFELACGTGYWTSVASESAKRIFASDLSENAIQLARERKYSCPVEFSIVNAMQFNKIPSVDLTMATFWWSHMPIQSLENFTLNICTAMNGQGSLLFVDNRFVQGSSTEISRTDCEGNTFQIRRIRDGTCHEVLKNFPSRSQLEKTLLRVGASVEIIETLYYWIAIVHLNPPSSVVP